MYIAKLIFSTLKLHLGFSAKLIIWFLKKISLISFDIWKSMDFFLKDITLHLLFKHFYPCQVLVRPLQSCYTVKLKCFPPHLRKTVLYFYCPTASVLQSLCTKIWEEIYLYSLHRGSKIFGQNNSKVYVYSAKSMAWITITQNFSMPNVPKLVVKIWV